MAGLLPTVALAATQSNVTYLDENGISNVCASATVVDSATTAWNGGWYVVQGTVVISQGVTFSGDVYLILSDDCDLSVENGIAGQGNLTVYAQSTDGAQGRMSVVGSPVMEGDCSVSRGIRVNGSFTVNGGTATSTTSVDESQSCGILVGEGGTTEGFGGYIDISGDAYVTAIGGTAAMMSCGIVVQICLTMTGGYLLAQASNNAKYYDSVYLGTLCLPGDSSYLWRSNAASTFADSTSDPYTDQQYNFLEIVCTYEEVTSKDTGWTTGLYVVNKNISIGNELFASINPVTVRVGGDVRLILAGGHKLTVHGRIEVNEGNSLTIYGQSSAGDKLVVNNSSGNAGIGGCNGCSSGSITINGGTVTAASEGDSAGIGGGGGRGYGYVTINGGTVNASSTYGAGIGGTTNSILSGNGDATIETSGIMGNTENFVGTINGITYYGIIVNGVQVTTVNKSNVLPNNRNGKVSYNADTNVLTIDGFLGDLLNPVTTVISGNGSTDIVLNGGGSFTAVGLTVTNAKNVTVTTNSTFPAILGDANITCSGDVSITNQNIAVYGTLTVKGAKNVTVTANGNVPVIFVDANISCSGEVQLVNNGGGKAIDGQLRIRKMDSLGYAIATGTSKETLTVYERIAACGIFGPVALDASVVKTMPLHNRMYMFQAKAATCTEDGYNAYWYCNECRKYFSDADGFNEISDISAWKKGDGKIDATGHTLTKIEAKAATCTEDGNSAYWTCDLCAKYFSDAAGTSEIEKDSWVIQAAHTLTKIEAKAATCTEEGNSAYWACHLCGKYFSDEAGTTEIEKDRWVIRAAGHSYGYVGNGDGTHTATCTICGDSFTKDHTFTDGSCVCGAEEISDEDGLKEALASGCTFIWLVNDIKLSSTLNLSDKIITLDFNGHTLTGNITLADNSASPQSILTLIDSDPAGGGVLDGNITLTRGSYGTASHLYANGGTVTGQVSLPSYVGGIYCTSNTPTVFKGYVGNYGEIHGGIFYGGINTSCIKEKTVTFMNGDSRYALEVVADGSKVVAPVEPAKEGCVFLGWYNGETEYTFGSALSESITLTARFSDSIPPV